MAIWRSVFIVVLFSGVTRPGIAQYADIKNYERKLKEAEQNAANKWTDIYIDTPLYTGMVNQVRVPVPGADQLYADSHSPFSATTVDGEYKATFSYPGMVTLALRNKITNKTVFVLHYKVVRSAAEQIREEPRLQFGNSDRAQVPLSKLEQLKEIMVSNGFTFKSAVVYYWHPNVQTIYYQHIAGDTLKLLDSLLAKCIPGSKLIFDNVKVFHPNGKEYFIAGPSIEIIADAKK